MRAGLRLSSPTAGLLALLAPPLCLLCRRVLADSPPPGPALCAGCRDELERAPARGLTGEGLDGGVAALPYSGAGRRLVAALKFSRLRSAADLGAALIEERLGALGNGAGVLVAVPAAPLRARRRGFDPADELARALAARSGLELTAPLERRDLRRQRGHRRTERLARPPAIVASGPAPAVAILLDDVVTTGATLTACARALRAAGSERVLAVALCAVRAPKGLQSAQART